MDNRSIVIKEIIGRVVKSDFVKSPMQEYEAYIGATLNRLADAVIDARQLNQRAIPHVVTSLFIATSEARLFGFILAVLIEDEETSPEL